VTDVAPADDQHVRVTAVVRGNLGGERAHASLGADDDDLVPRRNHRLAGRDDDVLRPHDGGECQRVESVRLPDGLAGERARLGNLELGHLDAAAGERVDVAGGGHADHPDDRPRGEEVRPDHEVDAERGLGLLPRVKVRRLLHAGDGEGLGDSPDRPAGDDVRLVVVGAGDDHVGVRDATLQKCPEVGPVPLHGKDVGGVVEFLDASRVDVDDHHLVGVSEADGDTRPDLAGTDDDYFHVRRPLSYGLL